ARFGAVENVPALPVGSELQGDVVVPGGQAHFIDHFEAELRSERRDDDEIAPVRLAIDRSAARSHDAAELVVVLRVELVLPGRLPAEAVTPGQPIGDREVGAEAQAELV